MFMKRSAGEDDIIQVLQAGFVSWAEQDGYHQAFDTSPQFCSEQRS